MGILFCLLVKKCGALHLCADFRSLNANTHLEGYPIPRIDELLDRLCGSCVFRLVLWVPLDLYYTRALAKGSFCMQMGALQNQGDAVWAHQCPKHILEVHA